MRAFGMKQLGRIAANPAVRAMATQVLADTFARAFGVAAPRLTRAGLIAQDANFATAQTSAARPDLWAFREFTSACMEEALASPAYAKRCQEALYDNAYRLGQRVRAALAPRDDEVAPLVSLLYALIEIEVKGDVPGTLTFSRCYFSGGYRPQVCAFMSHFDNGFVGGLAGGGILEFSARITQGDPCCIARMSPESGKEAAQ